MIYFQPISLFVQECAAGFYRLRSGSLASVPVSSAVPTAAGMGSCVQCQCNRHSSTCDAETSICQVNERVCAHVFVIVHNQCCEDTCPLVFKVKVEFKV